KPVSITKAGSRTGVWTNQTGPRIPAVSSARRNQGCWGVELAMHGPQFIETRSGNAVENRGAAFEIPTQRRASRTFPSKWSSWRRSKFLNPANQSDSSQILISWTGCWNRRGGPKGRGGRSNLFILRFFNFGI